MTKFSWQILNNHVDISDIDKHELSDEIALKVLEVEEVADDYIDIDVTPNRAHDCLSHLGIAREIATITARDFKDFDFSNLNLPNYIESKARFSDQVQRFMTVEINNVTFNQSPQWLQDKLADVDQKSINTVVDLTNYVMFAIGQPLHTYDMAKLPSSALSVRMAVEGESVELLDGKTYQLSPDNLVITDSNDRPLGLAGVKGGTSSQISDSTNSIILESANFDPTTVRRSASKLGLRTDALKRFENEPSPALCDIAVLRFCQLLLQEQPDVQIKLITDYYPNPVTTNEVKISLENLQDKLGTELDSEQISDICQRQSIAVNKSGDIYTFTAPYWRLDLKIPEDYAEEFGRLIGYDTITGKVLPALKVKASIYNLYTQIRNTLIDHGLSEVQTYSLVKKGDLETLKPLASDKGSLRKTISKQLSESLVMNARNAELFSTDNVGIFEIGSVFPETGEEKHLAIALSGKQKNTNKKLSDIRSSLESISPDLVANWNTQQVPGGVVVEVSIDNIKYNSETIVPESVTAKFRQFSNQPFITRDISVWVMEGGSCDHLEQLIQNNSGDNLLSYRLVDEFEKDGRQSLAYRLVFQHPEKTLTDDEVNQIMNNIYQKLSDQYELR